MLPTAVPQKQAISTYAIDSINQQETNIMLKRFINDFPKIFIAIELNFEDIIV